jgi:hypothetical protein
LAAHVALAAVHVQFVPVDVLAVGVMVLVLEGVAVEVDHEWVGVADGVDVDVKLDVDVRGLVEVPVEVAVPDVADSVSVPVRVPVRDPVAVFVAVWPEREGVGVSVEVAEAVLERMRATHPMKTAMRRFDMKIW